jgi:hypothetical protein
MTQIGFSKNTVMPNTPLIPATFTNSICYGQTGTGKTVGYILPNIEERIKLGHSFLIYDFKGNLHTQVKQIANKYNKLDLVYEIGKLWGSSINLLTLTSSSSLENIFSTLHGNTSEQYWKNASFNLFNTLVVMLKSFIITKEILEQELEDKDNKQLDYYKRIFAKYKIDTLSFKTMYSLICDPIYFSNFISEAKLSTLVLEKILKENEFKKEDKLYIAYDELINKLDSFKTYENLKDSNETSGKFGVIGVLSSVLSGIANLEFLNNDGFDIIKELNSSKIIILNVSSLGENIISALNIALYDELTKRVSYQKLNPISIFIDEAQKVLTSKYIPDVDVCRENAFEYILATQDITLLENKIGRVNMTEIKRNIATVFSFKTNDEMMSITNDLKRFEYIDFKDNKKYILEPSFVDKDEFDFVELEYQTRNNIFNSFSIKKINNTILLHQASLYRSHQAYQKDLITKEIKIIDCFSVAKIQNIKHRFKSIFPYVDTLKYELEDIKINNTKVEIINKENQKLKREMREKSKKIDKIEKDVENLSKSVTAYRKRVYELCGGGLFGGESLEGKRGNLTSMQK